MASLVNPSNINGNFPIAGQDNDSQGFRDNFTNIRNNFTYIKSEVEDLQAKAVLKSALSGGTLDNNFLGSQIKNAQFKNYSETLYDWGNTSGVIQLDFALGNVHKVYTEGGSISINGVIKNPPASLNYSRILLYITISNLAHTLTIPNTFGTDLSSIPGLRKIGGEYIVTFSETGTYIFEFSSVDSGTTYFVKELTRASHQFRDPDFYFDNIGTGLASGTHPSGFEGPVLRLGWGNLKAVSESISEAKNGTDVFSIHGSMTSFYTHAEGSENSALLGTAGFSVAKGRMATPNQGAAVSQTAAEQIVDGDLIGYYNAMALSKLDDGASVDYLQYGSIQFYAAGSDTTHGIGGNVIIATKPDGADDMLPAIIIDNAQNVTIKGCLTVDGGTTTINSTQLTVDDKNIIVASGAASATSANGAGIAVDTAFANIEYHGPASATAISTYGGGDRWIVNKSFAIANTAASTSSSTGALVIGGGLGVGGDLNVGGVFGLTATTQSTSKDTGAFVLDGGMGIEKNIVAGGGIFANSTTDSTNTTSGALVTAGGLGVAKTAVVGGNLVAASSTVSTSTTTGALVVTGGAGVAGRLNVGGNVFLSSGADSSYTMGTTGTSYTGALIVDGGAHVVNTLNIGNDSAAGKIVINSDGSTLNPTVGTSDTGGLIIGSVASSKYAGMSVSGNFNLGSDAGGVLYIKNKTASRGTKISGAGDITPYEVIDGIYGAATVLGGINVFGNIYVGQPAATTGGGSTQSGNIYIQSGTQSTSATTGALVIQKVKLPTGYNAALSPDGFSRGGLGLEGNLYAVGNVILGGEGASAATSIVTIDGTLDATTSTSAGFINKGGMYNAKVGIFGGNLVAASATAGLASTKQGALVIPTGGMYVGSTSYIAGNLVIASGGSGATGGTTTTGALVLAGTNGLGVGGVANFGGVVTAESSTAGGTGTGALVVNNGGASIAGNLYIQGSTQPINAVGASGVVPVSAAGTAFTTTTVQAGGQDISACNFYAEANKLYSFEAWILHDTSTTNTKGFGMSASAGTLKYVVEQNTSATGALSTVNYLTSGGGTVAAAGAATGMLCKITGTFSHTVATKVQLQAYLTATAGTLTVHASSYLKWTKLT